MVGTDKALVQRIYRYAVESFDILASDGSSTSVPPGMVSAIIMDRDYEQANFPVLGIRVNLTTSNYVKIISNKTTSKIRLRVVKYQEDNVNNRRVKSNVFNDVFVIMNDMSTPFTDTKEYDQINKTSSEGSSPGDAGGKIFNLYLFRERDLNASKKITNTVLPSTTIKSALAYLLSNSKSKDVLFQEPDNKKTYNQMMLYPYTTPENIDNLETLYGIYKSGALFFYDIDRTYLIDRSGVCKMNELQEYKKTIFHIKSRSNPDSLSMGTFDDTNNKNYLVNVPSSNVEITSPTSTTDQIQGSNAYYLDPTTGLVEDSKSSTTQIGDGTYRVHIDQHANPYTISAHKQRIEELNSVVSLTLGDTDISALTPNKEFMLVFEDTSLNKPYGGNYRLASSFITLIRNGGENMSLSGSILLKKTK